MNVEKVTELQLLYDESVYKNYRKIMDNKNNNKIVNEVIVNQCFKLIRDGKSNF